LQKTSPRVVLLIVLKRLIEDKVYGSDRPDAELREQHIELIESNRKNVLKVTGRFDYDNGLF
jgi:hypothetical protein